MTAHCLRHHAVTFKGFGGYSMIRIAVIIAVAASASACTSQANVPYSSKETTCKNYDSYIAFSGGGKWIKSNVNACIPNTPNKACVQYYDRGTRQTLVRCMPLTRKSPTAEGRARQLAGSKYP